MAAPLLTRVSCSSVIKTLTSGLNLTPVRLGTHRKLPTKKVINPFVQRRTDLIKRIVVALVQHERIQTTLQKAHDVQKYGDLVSTSCDFGNFAILLTLEFKSTLNMFVFI